MKLDELRRLDPTELRYALMELARQLPDAIALGRGDPDLPTPEHIVAAAERALRTPRTPVPPLAGMPELRAAIAANAERDHGLRLDGGNVLVTTGGQEGLFLVMSALLDPGDEILVPEPRYTSYDQAIAHSGGIQIPVPTRAEDGYDLSPDEIEARITPRTKALLIVTPSNPTGGILSRASAEGIAELARRHELTIVSDEIYGRFVYEPRRHHSVGALEGMAERTITLSGFSKSYAMTGWRVGYLLAPERVIDAMAAIKRATTGPVATVSQHAALAAASGPDDCIDRFREIYRGRRALFSRGLSAMGLPHDPPRGGFFFWVDSSVTGLRALELSYLLLEQARVLIFPGTAFGSAWSDHLRMTILQPDEILQAALERMTPVVSRHAGGQTPG